MRYLNETKDPLLSPWTVLNICRVRPTIYLKQKSNGLFEVIWWLITLALQAKWTDLDFIPHKSSHFSHQIIKWKYIIKDGKIDFKIIAKRFGFIGIRKLAQFVSLIRRLIRAQYFIDKWKCFPTLLWVGSGINK